MTHRSGSSPASAISASSSSLRPRRGPRSGAIRAPGDPSPRELGELIQANSGPILDVFPPYAPRRRWRSPPATFTRLPPSRARTSAPRPKPLPHPRSSYPRPSKFVQAHGSHRIQRPPGPSDLSNQSDAKKIICVSSVFIGKVDRYPTILSRVGRVIVSREWPRNGGNARPGRDCKSHREGQRGRNRRCKHSPRVDWRRGGWPCGSLRGS